MKRRILLHAISSRSTFFLYIVCACLAVEAAEPVSLAVLPFHYLQAGEIKDQKHWGPTIARLIDEEFATLEAVKMVDWESGEGSVRREVPTSSAEARRIGHHIKADQVLLGTYKRSNSMWVASARLVNISTDEISPTISAVSSNWFEIRDRLVAGGLAELGITPTENESERLFVRETTDHSALECFSKALSSHDPDQTIEWLLQALKIDTNYVSAYGRLAVAYSNRGEPAQAEIMAREFVRGRPDDAGAITLLAQILIRTGSVREGEELLGKAIQLEPRYVEAYRSLISVLIEMGKDDRALALCRQALQSEADRHIMATAGLLLAYAGEREKSLTDLRTAEGLPSADVNSSFTLFRAYEMLGEHRDASRHLGITIDRLRKTGQNEDFLKTLLLAQRQRTERLTPKTVEFKMPKVYSESDLKRVISQRLSPDEVGLVQLPLEANPEMKTWAERLVMGGTNELQKARMIYEALGKHENPGLGSSRSAIKAYEAWSKRGSENTISCHGYSLLYVALARHVGLQAFYAPVWRDAKGKAVYHACALVVAEDQGYLVDVRYQWFGVRHEEFDVFDDLQTTASHLWQQEHLRLAQIAVKLDPTSALAHFSYAKELLKLDPSRVSQLEQAEAAIQRGLEIDASSAAAAEIQALYEIRKGRMFSAIPFFRRSVELQPNRPEAHESLARSLMAVGRFKEARAQYLVLLDLDDVPPADAKHARKMVAKLDELISPN